MVHHHVAKGAHRSWKWPRSSTPKASANGIKAEKQVEKQIDMDSKDLDKALFEAEKELAGS